MKITHTLTDRKWYELKITVANNENLSSATLSLLRSARAYDAQSDIEIKNLLDILSVQIDEGAQYQNEKFLMQRNYDRVQNRNGYVAFRDYLYDIFALIKRGPCDARKMNFSTDLYCVYLGSLPEEIYADLHTQLARVYQNHMPLGTHQPWISAPNANDIPGMHEWEGRNP